MSGQHTDRILLAMLIASLGACDSGSQQTGAAAPAAGQPVAEAGESPAMEDRFANMFVSEVSNTFNPGVQIGERFPAIRALYQGEEITTIDRFIRDKGAIFIAVRSVDW